MSKPLFELGRLLMTPGASETMKAVGVDPSVLLRRHVTGDDGDLDADDKAMNKSAIQHGDRVFSSYKTAEGKVWVITEADRSATTILLPSEY